MKINTKLSPFYFFIILMPFILSSCMFFRHYTAYVKNNIKAVGGRTGQCKNATFYNVRIGTQFGTQATNPATFSELKPKFAIKLADGSILTSDEMTYDKISSLPNVMTRDEILEDKTYLNLFIDGYCFVFDSHREIIYFITENYNMNKRYNPMIGDINGRQFYSFPITQEQLESIFGTPDKYVNDYRL